jgi:hypothetical protein
MPPVSPQGSRGGLVTAVVVFTVLFVASTIFAIYYGVQDSKAEQSLDSLTVRYRNIALDTSSPDVSALIDQAHSDTKPLPEQTALAEAMRQRDDLRKLIVGEQPVDTTQPSDVSAQDTISQTIAEAQKAVANANTILGSAGIALPSDNLIQAINNLSLGIQNLDKAAQDAIAARDAAREQAAQDAQAATAQQNLATTAIGQAQESLQAKIDAANDAIRKAQDATDAARKTFEDE